MARVPRPRAYAPDPDAPRGHACDMPGCAAAGEYRAPKSRTNLRDFWWFCLEHVRAYNAGWDYYRGMTPAEVELQTRADTGWDRPTWPLGRLGGNPHVEELIHDPLSVLGQRRNAAAKEEVPAELRESLAILGLTWPTTFETAKARWKELAKRHHPDANGGDRAAEDRLKDINRAYAALRRHLAPAPRAAAL